MVDNLEIAVHVFHIRASTYFSVDKILLPKYMNWSSNFRGLLVNSIILVNDQIILVKSQNLFYLNLGIVQYCLVYSSGYTVKIQLE